MRGGGGKGGTVGEPVLRGAAIQNHRRCARPGADRIGRARCGRRISRRKAGRVALCGDDAPHRAGVDRRPRAGRTCVGCQTHEGRTGRCRSAREERRHRQRRRRRAGRVPPDAPVPVVFCRPTSGNARRGLRSDDDPSRREEELLSIVPRDSNVPFDMRRIITLVMDRGSFFEVGATVRAESDLRLSRASPGKASACSRTTADITQGR